jgi:hypothetical protein
MPTLKDLLGKTMLFTAAKAAGVDPWSTKVGKDDPVNCPAPSFNASTDPQLQAIWQWVHDPSAPAKITGLTAEVHPLRGDGSPVPGSSPMTMAVCDRIEALKVSVTLNKGDAAVDLPLTKDFVVAKCFLQSGSVQASGSSATAPGWWRLQSQVDASILVVFAYELVPGEFTSTPKAVPLSTLEEATFPAPAVGKDDPDFIEVPTGPDAGVNSNVPQSISGTAGAPQTLENTVTVVPMATWIIVCFSVTTCKLRPDFEPGGVLGAGRVYPHVMVNSTRGLAAVETTLAVDRPAKSAMKHDPEMMDDIKPLFVTDTNEEHDLFNVLSLSAIPPALPLWSNFFDYWDTDPPQGTEFEMVAPSRSSKRTVSGAIQRERNPLPLRSFGAGIYESSSDFKKFPSQGAYDNLHIAPRMQFVSNRGNPTISPIAMAPFCIHDCFHTHVRWGNPGGAFPGMPISTKGFRGRIPYQDEAAVLVPASQQVFIKLTSSGSAVGFEYRAIQTGSILPSTWTVFYHHGSAYALEVSSPGLVSAARFAVGEVALSMDEPFTKLSVVGRSANKVFVDVDPLTSWAAFYQRLHFTGDNKSNTWLPRVKINDLAKCRNG